MSSTLFASKKSMFSGSPRNGSRLSMPHRMQLSQVSGIPSSAPNPSSSRFSPQLSIVRGRPLSGARLWMLQASQRRTDRGMPRRGSKVSIGLPAQFRRVNGAPCNGSRVRIRFPQHTRDVIGIPRSGFRSSIPASVTSNVMPSFSILNWRGIPGHAFSRCSRQMGRFFSISCRRRAVSNPRHARSTRWGSGKEFRMSWKRSMAVMWWPRCR